MLPEEDAEFPGPRVTGDYSSYHVILFAKQFNAPPSYCKAENVLKVRLEDI